MTMQESQKVRNSRTLWITRGILFVAAVAMIIIGVANGETRTVLQKAVNICLECIGIG